MASEQVPTIPSAVPATTPAPLQAWLARLGLSGKVLAAGGLVGVLAVFLPLLSVSMELPSLGGAKVLGGKGGANLPSLGVSRSVLVVQDWRGVICLLGYVAALALTFVLYRPDGLAQKSLNWAGAGVGALVTLLALWLLVGAVSGASSLSGFGASLRVSVGIGAILNLLAAAAVTAGGVLKAREEQLI
jgi:hypothetical protein